jgi:polyhydroxyalkanoate synthesis repressor PhaR
VRIIKKYSNRRLYDTSGSRYINLDQFAALVRGGDSVKVLDATSGGDLTRTVLLQVILDTQGGVELFPSGLLHRIIRSAASNPMHRVMLKQLGLGLEMLDAQLGRMESQWGWMAGTSPSPEEPPPEEPPPDAPPPEEPPPETGQSAPGAGDGGSSGGPGGAGAPSELDALRERLASLEQRLRSDH